MPQYSDIHVHQHIQICQICIYSYSLTHSYIKTYSFIHNFVHQQISIDTTLGECHDHYTQLQQMFKQLHKQLDSVRKQNPGEPRHLRKELEQLEDEQHQLTDKIAMIERKYKSVDGFSKMLKATSALRKEQEEQHKLIERKHDQEMGCAVAEKRYDLVLFIWMCCFVCVKICRSVHSKLCIHIY